MIGQVSQTATTLSTASRQLASGSEDTGRPVGEIASSAAEAARGGEQGRGFAVVAEEVRKLAEGSRAAAGSIAPLVAAIQADTRHTVDVVEDGARRTAETAATVDRAREAFEAIGAAVDSMA